MMSLNHHQIHMLLLLFQLKEKLGQNFDERNLPKLTYENLTVKEINPTKFIKEMHADQNSIISAMMTAFIGTEMIANRINFTMNRRPQRS